MVWDRESQNPHPLKAEGAAPYCRVPWASSELSFESSV